MDAQAKVFLVGAGSGDPELLTVKAMRLIQEVEVVVYDRLVSPEIIALIPSGHRRVYVGKASGHHHLPQSEINELLIKLVQAGHRVLRLKGGDPFVFGRGSEEAQHLARHNIPFEIVPGITAASACSTYAGIPLTHRGISQHVHFVTGHGRDNESLELNWSCLATPDSTLVIYMGLANITHICQQLVDAGLPTTTPAAVVENGTTLRQRRYITSIASLPTVIKQEQIVAPALIIIGGVVQLADELDWFTTQCEAASEEYGQYAL